MKKQKSFADQVVAEELQRRHYVKNGKKTSSKTGYRLTRLFNKERNR